MHSQQEADSLPLPAMRIRRPRPLSDDVTQVQTPGSWTRTFHQRQLTHLLLGNFRFRTLRLKKSIELMTKRLFYLTAYVQGQILLLGIYWHMTMTICHKIRDMTNM